MSLVTLRAKLRTLVDDTYISDAEINDLIERATLKIERDLIQDGAFKPRQMLGSVTDTLGANGLTLPADFMRVRTVLVNNRRLRYASPDKLDPGSGNQDAEINLYYFKRIPRMTENGSNWLYDIAEDLYLYGTALQYSIYNKMESSSVSPQLLNEFYEDARESVCMSNAMQPTGNWQSWKGRPWGGVYTIEGDTLRVGNANA